MTHDDVVDHHRVKEEWWVMDYSYNVGYNKNATHLSHMHASMHKAWMVVMMMFFAVRSKQVVHSLV